MYWLKHFTRNGKRWKYVDSMSYTQTNFEYSFSVVSADITIVRDRGIFQYMYMHIITCKALHEHNKITECTCTCTYKCKIPWYMYVQIESQITNNTFLRHGAVYTICDFWETIYDESIHFYIFLCSLFCFNVLYLRGLINS